MTAAEQAHEGRQPTVPRNDTPPARRTTSRRGLSARAPRLRSPPIARPWRSSAPPSWLSQLGQLLQLQKTWDKVRGVELLGRLVDGLQVGRLPEGVEEGGETVCACLGELGGPSSRGPRKPRRLVSELQQDGQLDEGSVA